MPDDEHLAVLGRGAAAWNAWRAEHHEAPDLSRAGLGRPRSEWVRSFSRRPAGRRPSGNQLLRYQSRRRAPRRREFVQGADLAPGPSFTARIPDSAQLVAPGTRARPVALSRRSPLERNAPA